MTISSAQNLARVGVDEKSFSMAALNCILCKLTKSARSKFYRVFCLLFFPYLLFLKATCPFDISLNGRFRVEWRAFRQHTGDAIPRSNSREAREASRTRAFILSKTPKQFASFDSFGLSKQVYVQLYC